MAKIKAFESTSVLELENKINEWLRNEWTTCNNKINIKTISHCHAYEGDEPTWTALIVYEYN